MTSFPGPLTHHFEPIRLLACGGFGEVHLAKDRRLDRLVVVKLLLAGLLDDPEQVQRFMGEARVTAMIDHPHVVKILDHDVIGTIPYIVYEYLEGKDLQSRIDGGPLPLEDALPIAIQVCEALQAAHERGVLHRDVKGPNVLGAGPEHWKLTDFGIAKWQNRPAVKTQTGMVLGTPTHLAPELIRGRDASASSDLYATGILLFEMVVGKPPFPGPGVAVILDQQLHRTAPRLGTVRRGVPLALESLVADVLEKDPADRPGSAAELAAALREIPAGKENPAADRGTGSGRTALATHVREQKSQAAVAATTAVRPRTPDANRGPGAGWVVALLGLAAVAVLMSVPLLRGKPAVPPSAIAVMSVTSSSASPEPAKPRTRTKADARRWGENLKLVRKRLIRWRGDELLTQQTLPQGKDWDDTNRRVDELIREPIEDRRTMAEVHVFKALLLESKGRVELARRSVDEAADLDPDDKYLDVIRDRLDQRIANLALVAPPELEKAIEKGRQLNDSDPGASVTVLTQALENIRYREEVAPNLRDAAFRALVLRGSARKVLKDYPGALEDASQALRIVPDGFWAMLLIAETHEAMGDPRALPLFLEATRVATNVQAHRGAARLLAKTDVPKAIRLLESGLAQNYEPIGRADLQVELGVLLAQQGKELAAMEHLIAGLESLPHPNGPWLLLFELEVKHGLAARIGAHLDLLRTRERTYACFTTRDLMVAPWFATDASRLELLKSQMPKDPTCEDVRNLLQLELERGGDVAAREALIEEGLAASLPAYWAVKSRGDRLNAEQRFEEALKLYGKVQKVRALEPGELLGLADCQMKLGRLVEAKTTLDLVSRKSPDNPWERLERAVLSELRGEKMEAEKGYRTLLSHAEVGNAALAKLKDLLRAANRMAELEALEAGGASPRH